MDERFRDVSVTHEIICANRRAWFDMLLNRSDKIFGRYSVHNHRASIAASFNEGHDARFVSADWTPLIASAIGFTADIGFINLDDAF